MTPISLVIADDQDLIRASLTALLSREPEVVVVGEARDGHEAVAEARRLRPDLVLMDVRMPGLDGAGATAQIRGLRGLEGTRVLILTTFEDDEVVVACLNAGADGFIGKGVSFDALIDAIQAVHRGESPLSPRAARAVLEGLSPMRTAGSHRTQYPSGLTARELEIVSLVGRGIDNLDIGRQLSISPATVKTHVKNAMAKLHVHDRAQLVALAHRIGLVR